MSAERAANPGLELAVAVIRDGARDQPCPACGDRLGDCRVELRDVEFDRLSAEISCAACGASHLITASPASEDGSASIQ